MAEQNGNQKQPAKGAAEKPEKIRFWKISAPNAEYSGIHPSGLRFEQGVALTRDKATMELCRDTELRVEAVFLIPEAPLIGGGNPEGTPAEEPAVEKK